MANVTLKGVDYPDVPALDVPQTGGGSVRFHDVSITTATVSDVANGKVFLDANGVSQTGTLSFSSIYTGSSAPSSSLGVDGDIYLQV